MNAQTLADAPPMRAPPAPPTRVPPKVPQVPLVGVELPRQPSIPEEEIVATEVKHFEGNFFSFLEEEEDVTAAPKQVMRARPAAAGSFFAGRLEEGEDDGWLDATIDAPKPCYASPGSNSTVVPSEEGDENRLSDSESGQSSELDTPEASSRAPKKTGIQHVQSGDTHTRKRIAQEAALHAATAWGDWPKQHEQRGKGQYVHIEAHQHQSSSREYQQTAEAPRMYSLNVNKRPAQRGQGQWW